MASPFEHAWMLLKNEGEMPFQNNYDEDPHELPEPNPLDAALAQARNQGPAPGANLEALPPAGPDPKGISNMFGARRANPVPPVERGIDKYSTPRPPIERPEVRQEISNPPPHERAIKDALDAKAAARAKKIHEERMDNDFQYYLQNLQNDSHQLF